MRQKHVRLQPPQPISTTLSTFIECWVSIFTMFNLPHIHCYHSQTLKSHCRTHHHQTQPLHWIQPTTLFKPLNPLHSHLWWNALVHSDDSLIVTLATQILFSYDYTCENAAMHTLVGLHTVHFSLVLYRGI